MRFLDKLHCSLLLELPSQNLEQRFWTHEKTIRAYANWDVYILVNLVLTNLTIAATLLPAISDPQILRHTWHLHLNALTNLVACPAHLFYIQRTRQYAVKRRKLVIVQRLVRLAFMLLGVLQSGQGLQSAAAKALNKVQGDQEGPTDAKAAAFNIVRPLGFSPVMAMAQGNWVFEAKFWLPLQLLTTLMAIFGMARHQHCRLASDPISAPLLQPTCQSLSSAFQYMLSSILGPSFSRIDSLAHQSAPLACSNMLMAARVLSVYMHAAYGALMPAVGFGVLEWRLKARWARSVLGRQLVYGPWSWPRSQAGPLTFLSGLQQVLKWVVCVAVGQWLLWVLCCWAVPHLPMLQCETCEDRGTCRGMEDCEGLDCSNPTSWTVFLLYTLSIMNFIVHFVALQMV